MSNALVTVISTEIDKLKQLMVKVRRYGKNDVVNPKQIAAYGIDSNPVKDMVALYAKTSTNGKHVIIGYLNKNLKAQPGELRLFSTDQEGSEKGYLWLKNNGQMELMGSAHNIVRYNPLDQGLQSFKAELMEELAKIATGISTGGGTYTPGNLNIDISNSKVNEVKTT